MQDDFPQKFDEEQRKAHKQELLDQDFNRIFSKSKMLQRKNFKERLSMSQVFKEDPAELLAECKEGFKEGDD